MANFKISPKELQENLLRYAEKLRISKEAQTAREIEAFPYFKALTDLAPTTDTPLLLKEMEKDLQDYVRTGYFGKTFRKFNEKYEEHPLLPGDLPF